jgi:hypothetical protein
VGESMQGTRLPDGEWLSRAADGEIKPGDYGQCDAGWFVCCPNGSTTRLWVDEDDRNGNRHVVTEHDDGSISVGGSILGREVPSERIGGVGPIAAEGWHGWLEHGVWREC